MSPPILAAALCTIVARMDACAQAQAAPDINPLLDDDGSHVVTPHLRIVNGQLVQLWTPADWTKNASEWRVVDGDEFAPSVMNLSGTDGGTQT